MGQLLIYGSYGYTGELVVAEAKARGLAPILAGRRAEALQAQAEPLGTLCTQACVVVLQKYPAPQLASSLQLVAQVPPAPLHAKPLPQAVLAQHTPPTQLPLAHCPPLPAQAEPLAAFCTQACVAVSQK